MVRQQFERVLVPFLHAAFEALRRNPGPCHPCPSGQQGRGERVRVTRPGAAPLCNGHPLYAEADVDQREGPLEVPRGLLPDLAQIQEALEIGFDGLDPLQPAAITLFMKHILR